MTTTTQTMIVDDEFIAFRVRSELGRKKLSQRRLARDLGWTVNFLNRRIRAEVPFTAVEIAQVAEILNVDVSCFYPQADIGRAS